MNMKNILLFIGGLVTGGAAGVFGTMKYFQEKYQRLYEEDRADLEYYYQRTDEYYRREEDDDGVNDPNELETRPGGRMTEEEREKVKKKQKILKNWEGTTNYAAMYQTNNDLAENEHPLDQGEDGEEEIEDEEITAEEEAFDEHQKNMHKPPKIISADTYSELPAHIEKCVLYFYAYDEMLCDENEEPVEEPGRLIGDALTKYGFVDSDERIIFVMNYSMDIAYEIQKLDMSWTDTH